MIVGMYQVLETNLFIKLVGIDLILEKKVFMMSLIAYKDHFKGKNYFDKHCTSFIVKAQDSYYFNKLELAKHFMLDTLNCFVSNIAKVVFISAIKESK